MAGPVTLLLEAARRQDPDARGRLFDLVQAELRRLASARLRHERPGHGLETSLLVDDLFVRLLGGCDVPFENRRHFFGAAAEAIRRMLIDHARGMSVVKRGGRMHRVDLDLEAAPSTDTPAEAWGVLERALAALAAQDPRAAEVVRLRYFAGLTVEQTALVLAVNERTVRRDWVFAARWLEAAMGELESGEQDGRQSP